VVANLQIRRSAARARSQVHESTGIGKKDLRQMQGDPPARCGAGDLQQPEAQATPGIIRAFRIERIQEN
jgi:hypothetical protein